MNKVSELSVGEIDMLIEAVKAWTTAKQSNTMITAMMIGIITKNGKECEQMLEGTKEETKQRKEQGNAIIAKLYVIREVVKS